MNALPNELRHWRNRGESVEAFGHEVFIVEEDPGRGC
jgi:hypothetical protein